MYSTVFSRVVFPVLELVLRRHISSTAAEYTSLQYGPYEQLKTRQEAKMRSLLHHAFENVPFYRIRFEQAGLKPDDIQTIEDLPKLPVVTKEEIRANFPHQITATNISRHRRVLGRTSGSTGKPLEFYWDNSFRDGSMAAFVFFDSWAGIKLGDRCLHVGLEYENTVTGRIFDFIQRKRYLFVLDMNENNIVEVCSQLAGMKVDVIEGYALKISWIAMVAKHNNIKIRPGKAVICTSQILPSKKLLEDAFQCPVINRYGNLETCGAIAQNCLEGNKLHVNTELCILEIVDDEGNTCPPGQRGRVIITDLNNWAMPFIRYDTEDGAAGGEPCSCGRTLPIIENLEPRLAQYIRTPSGNVVTSGNLGNFLFILNDYMPYFVKYQAVQESPDKVIFNFVPLQPVTQDLVSKLHEDLQLLFGGVSVEVNAIDDIPVAPSGKEEIIKSKLGQAELLA